MDKYNAGALNDHGGGIVDWWHGYIHSELNRAHEFYSDAITSIEAELAAVTAEREKCRLNLAWADALLRSSYQGVWPNEFHDWRKESELGHGGYL